MKPRITIIGAGESGIGAALLAQQKGYDTFVSSKDKIAEKYKAALIHHAIDFEENKHTVSKIVEAQLIVKSPGVPYNIAPLQEALSKNIAIIDEVEFAFRYLKGKIIGISGTNGKTTVAHLVYHLMKVGGANVALAGNVGTSLARKVVENNYDWYVVELSSFQLEGITTFAPNISILLNITPDHLSRHDHTFENYSNAKFQLIKNATERDYFIYYMDDPNILRGLKSRLPKARQLTISSKENRHASAFFDGAKMNFPFFEKPFKVAQQDTALKGTHNYINIMASILAAHLASTATHRIKEGIATFKRMAHRLESIATLQGIEFVNDSKATNADATKCALECYETPLIWIAGGIDKGNNYDLIRQQVQEKVKMLLCLGKENSQLKNYFSPLVPAIKESKDIKELVKIALEEGDRGDVVLLSPACASADLFANYEDRGNQFRQAVLQLKEGIKNTLAP